MYLSLGENEMPGRQSILTFHKPKGSQSKRAFGMICLGYSSFVVVELDARGFWQDEATEKAISLSVLVKLDSCMRKSERYLAMSKSLK